MGIRIYLTGQVALEVDGKLVIDERQFRGKQGRLAFAYLVCERTRSVPREEMAKVVWPREMAPAWEIALSALMSRLRWLLARTTSGTDSASISRGFADYQLHLPIDAWIDLEAATSAIDEAEGALRAGNPGRVLGPATVATTIARRPFLSGIEGEWVDAQRRKLERQLIRALESLSKMWLSLGESDLAVETATEAVELDSFRDSSYQLLMRAYVSSGNRAKGVGVYDRLRGLLAEELGTYPSAETQALYLELLG